MAALAAAGLAVYAVPAALSLAGAEPSAWWIAVLGGALVLAGGMARSTRAGGRMLLVILLAGAAFRAVLVPTSPALSDDLYRYLWDGRVQAAGIDVYAHPPADPALEALRDEVIWPHVNRPAQRTIYPPAAQALFALTWGAGIRTPTAWKGLMATVDVAAMVLLAMALRTLGRDPRLVVAYAWNPLAVLSSGQSGHLEPLVVLALAAAVIAWRREHVAGVGLALGFAAALKLYPLGLLPAFLRGPSGWSPRAAATVTVLAVTVLAVGYLDLGAQAFGYLTDGYLREESYASGGRFILFRAAGLDGRLWAPAAVAAVGLAALTARRAAPAKGAWLLGAALLATLPYPWYGLPLVALAVMGGAGWAWVGFPIALQSAYLDRGWQTLELWRPLRVAAAVTVIALAAAAIWSQWARRAVVGEPEP